MTFSICVRERYEEDGDEQLRFGVAVTTRLAGVGRLCPFASEYGAVATQSLVNVDLGRRGLDYLEDGLGIEDALDALLSADDGREGRQLHGVGREGEYAFSGGECKPWYGHHVGGNYTVAGNLLTGEDVIAATAEAYETGRDEDRRLAERLIDALAAGHAEGGDRREELTVQSAAVRVVTTEETEGATEPAYDDLRVDASESPIEELRETYELAVRGHEEAMARYEEAYEDDEMAASS